MMWAEITVMIMMMKLNKLTLGLVPADESVTNCRDRNNFLRQDGGLCFEIPPWQHQPVELESHLQRVDSKWGPVNSSAISRKQTSNLLGSGNSDVTRYMDTVIAPFLDTYHRNIQNAYQQLTTKILGRIKEEVNAAVKRKQVIYKELTQLAEQLEITPLCNEELRSSRTLASSYVAQIHACTEDARASIAKMGKYAEEMIAITRNHMQQSVGKIAKAFNLVGEGPRALKKPEIERCLQSLSKSAVSLGYELDLSLTNARRHNEQSCEKLTACTAKARKHTDEGVLELKDLMYQCVYA